MTPQQPDDKKPETHRTAPLLIVAIALCRGALVAVMAISLLTIAENLT